MTEKENTCYSSTEKGFMVWGQNARAKVLTPLLKLLKHFNVTANQITFASLVSGMVAAFVMLYSKEVALALILLHVVLDGVDGPFARYTQTASNKGSFTDTATDQIVIAAVTFSLIHLQIIDALAGGIYVLLYTVVVGFAMIRNSLNIPYSWLIRPRFIIYAWLPVEFYYLSGSTNYILWLFNALLILKAVTGYLKIHKAM